MNIMFTPSISFSANRIDSSTPKVKKLDVNSLQYNDEDVYCVEIMEDEEDKEALKCVSENWDQATFAQNLYEDAAKRSENYYDTATRFLALTTQKKNWNHLDYQKVLALCELTEKPDKEVFVEFIEANPDSVNNPYAEYKKVGSSLLGVLKDLYDKITLRSTPTALEFYERNNFKPETLGSSILYWDGD